MRLRCSLPPLAVLALALAWPGADALAQAKRKPAAARAPAFKVEIEQDGKLVEIKDHEAYLRRDSFAILVTLPDKKGVFVSASLDASLYEEAKAGTPFASKISAASAVAEGVGNEPRQLYLSVPPEDVRLHLWGRFDDPNLLRFDGVERVGSGYRGRRTVSRYWLGPEKTMELKQAPRAPLHLVFVRGTPGADWVVAEEQREYVRLFFDTAPPAVKSAVKADVDLLLGGDKPLAEREAALARLAGLGRQAIVALDAIAFETRILTNEVSALADLRQIVSAENFYASLNGGFYDQLECLETPSRCIPKYRNDPPRFLEALPAERHGYRRAFHPGPAVARDGIKKAKASPSSLSTYAVSLVPVAPGESGIRSFCGDFTGRVCAIPDGSPPEVSEGRCPASCREP